MTFSNDVGSTACKEFVEEVEEGSEFSFTVEFDSTSEDCDVDSIDGDTGASATQTIPEVLADIEIVGVCTCHFTLTTVNCDGSEIVERVAAG